MKKLSILLLALTVAGTISAAPQDYDHRVDASRVATDESRMYRGDRGGWDRGDGRVAEDLSRLRREVRSVREMIGDSRSQRIRDRFHHALRTTDFLEDQFRRRRMNGGEIRRRADGVRAELDGIRRDLQRDRRHGGWR